MYRSATHIDGSELRMAFVPVFLFAYLVQSALIAVLLVTFEGFHPATAFFWAVFVVFVLPVSAAALSLILSRHFSYAITRSGLHGYTWSGRDIYLEWDAIGNALPTRLLNLEFVRLVPRNGDSPLWLPQFIRVPVHHERDVQNAALEPNPATRAG